MYEQELKLTAPDGDTLDRVLNATEVRAFSVGPASGPHRYLAKYYDNGQRTLTRQRCALRSRLEGNVFRAALKQSGHIVDGMSERAEMECDVDGWLNNLDDLPDGSLKSELLQYLKLKEPLVELVEVEMDRTIRNLDIDGTRVELVADRGTIRAGGRETRIYEIEMELKMGNVSLIKKLGNNLKAQYDLVPSTKTKYEIGLDLWQ